MKAKLLLFIMLLSFLSCTPRAEYEIIKKNIISYEFSKQQDKIYMLDNKGKLSIYNTENKTTKNILENIKFDTRDVSMYATDLDTLYIVTNYYMESSFRGVYIIYNDKLISKIPKIEMKSIRKLYENTSKLPYNKFDIWALSKYISNLEISSVSILPSEKICILQLNNDKQIALDKRMLDKDTEIIKAVNSLAKNIAYQEDRSFRAENIGKKKTVNYFENKKIVIEETSYQCEFKLMGYTKGCKYKIKITRNKKSVKLKDKLRKSRALGFEGKNHWNNDLNNKIPYSKYITDKNGDIYLPFYFGEEQNLIKISK